jgi:hypothetical protein
MFTSLQEFGPTLQHNTVSILQRSVRSKFNFGTFFFPDMPFVVAIQYHIYRYLSDVSLSLSYCYSSIPEHKQRAIVHTGNHSLFYQCGSLYESTIYVCARLFVSLTPHKYFLCTVTLASGTPSAVTGSTTGSSSTATEQPSDVTVFGYR